MQNNEKVYKGIQECAKLFKHKTCKFGQKYAKLCRSMNKFIGMLKYAKLCRHMKKYENIQNGKQSNAQ